MASTNQQPQTQAQPQAQQAQVGQPQPFQSSYMQPFQTTIPNYGSYLPYAGGGNGFFRPANSNLNDPNLLFRAPIYFEGELPADRAKLPPRSLSYRRPPFPGASSFQQPLPLIPQQQQQPLAAAPAAQASTTAAVSSQTRGAVVLPAQQQPVLSSAFRSYGQPFYGQSYGQPIILNNPTATANATGANAASTTATGAAAASTGNVIVGSTTTAQPFQAYPYQFNNNNNNNNNIVGGGPIYSSYPYAPFVLGQQQGFGQPQQRGYFSEGSYVANKQQ